MESCVLKANDTTINRYVRLATMLATQNGVDWQYEWRDGGRATFYFGDGKTRDAFVGLHFFFEE